MIEHSDGLWTFCPTLRAMHVDAVIDANSISGTLSGSLVRGSSGSDGGVQICIVF